MAETIQNLLLGFSTAFLPVNLFYAFMGCLIGTMVGVLPGVGPLAGISLLLPSTFGLDPTAGLILLAGVFYGAMYGGSTTSILMRIPGEAASVMTCIDGYAMALKGRAGAALAIAAIGSYVAGTLSVVGLMFLAPPLARFALRFGPPEYFSLLALGLLVLGYMTGGSMIKNLAMIVLGLLFGMIGIDHMSGYFRFSYGIVALGDGIGVVPVAVGLFGIAEILATAGNPLRPEVLKPKLKDLLPSRQEFRDSVMPIGRGTVLGFLIGIIPGSAHIISTFMSYAVERRISKHPEKFGQGAIEGVAGSGVGQQCGQLRSAGPDAGAGCAHRARAGRAAGGADGPRDQPGTAFHQRAAGDLLGSDRQHVCGEFGAASAQPAAGGDFCQLSPDPLSDPLSHDPDVLHHRGLCGQHQLRGRGHHEHHGLAGLSSPQIRF